MSQVEVKRGMCWGCKPRCLLDVYIKDGVFERVGPAPVKGCPRWRRMPELFYHPDRLKFPLKRLGERGQGKWEQISWDQALDEIADRLREIRDKHGAEAVAGTCGTKRTYEEVRARFFNLFGSPNIIGPGQICYGNSVQVAAITYGWIPYWMSTEKLAKVNCVMLIGRDPAPSHQNTWEGIVAAKKERNAKLIVIDPRRCTAAMEADLWLQLRPGTDCALLLAMTNVIIEEGLYDNEFVDRWCHGFDQLKERVKDYPVAKVAEITWIPAEKIREAARMFARNKPSCAIEGMGVAHQPNATDTLRARYIISAIVGNVDVEGGEKLLGAAPWVTGPEIELSDMLPQEQKAKLLGGDRFRLCSWPAFEMVRESTHRAWGKFPGWAYAFAAAHAPTVYRAMITGKPYPVKAAITLSSNPLLTPANSKLVYQALQKLELYIVVDYFMTPSAEIADYVLPSASWLERPFVFNYSNATTAMKAADAVLPASVPGQYDRRNDFEFWRGLGIRLGQEKYWPWKTLQEYYDYRLKSMGLTFAELVKRETWTKPREFKKYEKVGFGTPTGKVELWSTVLDKLGYDPLPQYKEPHESPLSTPELAQKYPFILITGGRFYPYFHSEYRQVESFRKTYPYATVEAHPETAKGLGIADGDWVWIETPTGRILQKCKYFDGIHPQVVHAQHGWWYPELPGEEPWLHGVWVSNVNVLLDDDPDRCDEAIGSWPLRGVLCRVYKAKKY